jgi:Flp pilus assembly protein TadG
MRQYNGGVIPARTEGRCLEYRHPGERLLSRFIFLFRGSEGTAAVEFGLAAPLLLGLLVPIVDLGMACSQRIQVQQSAQAGAQYAAFHPWNTNSPSEIANAARSASTLSGITTTPSPFQVCGCPTGSTVSSANCGSTCANSETAGYYVVVTTELPYTPMLPYSVLGNSVTLTAQSTVRIR